PAAGARRQVGGESAGADAEWFPRRAPRDPLDAFVAGQARRLAGRAVRTRVVGAGVGSVDGAVAPLPEHALQLVVLHGGVALRADDVRRDRDGLGEVPE